MIGHQIKIAGGALPRIGTIVHAQQAQALERNGAHGHQGGKLHPTPEEALLQARRFQCRKPMLANHCQWQRLRHTGLITQRLPLREFLLEAEQHALVGFVVGFKKACHQAMHHLRPLRRRMRMAQLPKADGHCLKPTGEMAHLECTQSRHLRQRQDTLPGCVAICLTCRIAQQQTLQTISPRVLLRMRHVSGDAPLLPMRWI